MYRFQEMVASYAHWKASDIWGGGGGLYQLQALGASSVYWKSYDEYKTSATYQEYDPYN